MKNKLPNATAVLVLGILSIPACFCWGFPGIILAVIALVLAHKDQKLYEQQPDVYDNYVQITTGRILAVIGLTLSLIVAAFFAYLMTLSQEELKSFEENLRIKAEQQRQEQE